MDDYLRYVTVYFMKMKSQLVEYFLEYKALVENQLDKKIKCIRTDNGGEYLNGSFSKTCKQAGIRNQTTVSYASRKIA